LQGFKNPFKVGFTKTFVDAAIQFCEINGAFRNEEYRFMLDFRMSFTGEVAKKRAVSLDPDTGRRTEKRGRKPISKT
jgi:hypothetical protein